MASDVANDKISIKNILFTKALPNYIAPTVAGRHKVYACTDCGDKYSQESSLETHVNRKSLKITYTCRHCGHIIVFLNRCKLLSHIRSHAFKTATINVSDLKIEPLPIEFYNIKPFISDLNIPETQKTPSQNSKQSCFECKEEISQTGVLYKDRANHYMQISNNMTYFSCPICLYSLPTSCGLKAHLRIHLAKPPYFCPECGVHIPNKYVTYPYGHDCEGFKTIRATTRLKCYKKNCSIFHPNDFREHMKTHIIKLSKCLVCYATWTDNLPKHKFAICKDSAASGKYFKCPLCPDKLFSVGRIHKHINSHLSNNNILHSQVFPCRLCNNVYEQVQRLLRHQIDKHGASKTIIESLIPREPIKAVYKVVKRCDECLRSFTYRCPYDKIKILPSECPYKCSSSQIKCFVCKMTVNSNWNHIKKHFSELHKEHKCVDVKVNLRKIIYNPSRVQKVNRTTKQMSKKIQKIIKTDNRILETSTKMDNDNDLNTNDDQSTDKFACNICGLKHKNKKDLESHIVSHKDVCMAYQCLECGQCFAVKPSFSTHLLIEHHISDVEKYISEKNCFNKLAFSKNQNKPELVEEGPIEENQCRICREKFNDHKTLEKHFRVHGMAFLIKNTSTKNCSP